MAAIKPTGLPTTNPSGLADWMRQRRAALRMSQRALARAAGISHSTVKLLEKATAQTPRLHPSTDQALRRILGTPDTEPQIPLTGGGIPVLVAVHYDPMGDLRRLEVALRGAACEVEPRLLYVDPASAQAWLRLCSQQMYAQAHREALPLRRVAQLVVESIGAGPLTMIALGSGDAQSEVRLLQHLIDRRGSAQGVAMHLLDFSHFLMSVGGAHARERLVPQGVVLGGIAADFHRLGDCTAAWCGDGRRARLFTILGWTLGNQPDDVHLLETVAQCAQPGDFLAFDFTLSYVPSPQPELIQRLDPALNNPFPVALSEWMSLPLRRYGPAAADVEMAMELGPAARIPGSYEIRCFGRVRVEGRERSYLLTRAKRYDPDRLQQALRRLGWEPVACLPLDHEQRPDALMVCRRLS